MRRRLAATREPQTRARFEFALEVRWHGSFPAESARRGRREQPQGETEFVCLSERSAGGLGGIAHVGAGRDVGERAGMGRGFNRPAAPDATWANVGGVVATRGWPRLVANAGRAMKKRQERRAVWPAGVVMNGVGNAARSEA
ncbi:MAG: hypothetical protein HBSAPP03_03250 [Phycisphaerae bacterium]|nr:MAG: hypothetical protein HBSAPP03_03250 [Phycisphaerae bacterium]